MSQDHVPALGALLRAEHGLEQKVVWKRRSFEPRIPRYLPSWEWLLNLIAKVYGPTWW